MLQTTEQEHDPPLLPLNPIMYLQCRTLISQLDQSQNQLHH